MDAVVLPRFVYLVQEDEDGAGVSLAEDALDDLDGDAGHKV